MKHRGSLISGLAASLQDIFSSKLFNYNFDSQS
jgi:hypothetical protein